jgi:peptide/nickel transport system substrate-binding protein
MKNLRWQFLVVLIALVAIGVLLLSQQQPGLPGEDVADQPASGGIYTEALIGSLGRLNPLLDYYNPVDRDVNSLIFSSLVKFDHRGLPHGDLADTWGISQDGKVYNFSIRTNAVWHDGRPVTSADVIYTIELMRDEAMPIPSDLRNFWKKVEVKELDEKTLQFRLPEPFSPFLDYLTFGVVPKHVLGNLSPEQVIDAPFNLQPVGSGPFTFQNLDITENKITGLVLESFDKYYGKQSFIEKLVFKYYPDAQSAMASYDQGEVMGISQVTADILDTALKNQELDLFTGRLPRLNLVFLNLDDPSVSFFQDPDIRRALLLGINRQWIIDNLMDGQAIIAHSPIFPESWAYFDGIDQVEYDPEKALALLKKAGYSIPAEGGQVRSKDGVPLSFEMVYPEGEKSAQIAERIRQDWERLGVDVSLNPVSYEELQDDYLEPRDYQAALVELNLARSPDPDPYPFWHQSQIISGQNYSQWDDRQVSEYLEQARVTDDMSERAKRYRNFQVRFASELPALPLFYPVYSYGVDSEVRGVSMGPLYDTSDRFNNLASWFLITSPVAGMLQTPTTVP